MTIGEKFPDLSVKYTDYTNSINEINLSEFAIENKKKVLLFWYPKDFTYICPTELFAFQAISIELNKRNTALFAASCDTIKIHQEWLKTEPKEGGIKGIKYPIISDFNRTLSSKLNILEKEDLENGKDLYNRLTYRATYIINEQGIIQHIGINQMSVGRNALDYLRILDALIHVEENGEVCPANWEKGRDAIKEDRISTAKYLSRILSSHTS